MTGVESRYFLRTYGHPPSEELQGEVLELRKLADRLKKHAEELAIRSAELEKFVQRAKRRSPETKPGR